MSSSADSVALNAVKDIGVYVSSSLVPVVLETFAFGKFLLYRALT